MILAKKHQKVIIADFSQGNLEGVKSAHTKHKDQIFEYVPKQKKSHFERLIFYSFLNSQFDVIKYYLENVDNPIELSLREVYILAKKLSTNKRFVKWIFFLKMNKEVERLIKFENFFETLKSKLTDTYDYESIELFIQMFPEEVDDMIKKCSKTPKGIQLKRHLTLTKIDELFSN